MTTTDLMLRVQSFLDAHPSYKMGAGPCFDADLALPWDHKRSDCSSAACWLLGIAKHSKGRWWGTANIWTDALNAQRVWRSMGPVHASDKPAPVGAIVVYPTTASGTGHCGVVIGGTWGRPDTVECRSRLGAWRGVRNGLWIRKGAIYVVPVGEV